MYTVKSFWRGIPDNVFGPFETRAEAEMFISSSDDEPGVEYIIDGEEL